MLPYILFDLLLMLPFILFDLLLMLPYILFDLLLMLPYILFALLLMLLYIIFDLLLMLPYILFALIRMLPYILFNHWCLYICFKTRIQDWKAGGLETDYFLRMLYESDAILAQYEATAVSGVDGTWACHWDRYASLLQFSFTTASQQTQAYTYIHTDTHTYTHMLRVYLCVCFHISSIIRSSEHI